MWVKFRHKVAYAIFKPIFKVFLFFKYGYTFAKFKCDIKKPYFILSNHITTTDMFMVPQSFNTPLYFIASDDLFSMKFFSPIIKYLVAPIPKTKSSSDLKTIKDCYKIASEGGSICVFPEGNRTYNGVTSHIPFSIVKLVKLLKLPLIIYRLSGGYGIQPRWSDNIRRGKMHGQVYRVLHYDNYKNMKNEDLYKYICDSLYVNAFIEAEESGNKFKSAKKAEYIERFLYTCPDCKSFSTLYSDKNYIICKNCGLKIEYRQDLKLKTLKGKCNFENVKQWDDFQKDCIRNYNLDNINNKEIIFYDENVCFKENIRCKRKVELGIGKITLFKDRFEISADNKHILNIKDINSIAIFGKNKMQIYYKNNIFQIIASKNFNALKYQNMFYNIKNKINGVTDEFLGL